jgi:hypothetical protein
MTTIETVGKIRKMQGDILKLIEHKLVVVSNLSAKELSALVLALAKLEESFARRQQS